MAARKKAVRRPAKKPSPNRTPAHASNSKRPASLPTLSRRSLKGVKREKEKSPPRNPRRKAAPAIKHSSDGRIKEVEELNLIKSASEVPEAENTLVRAFVGYVQVELVIKPVHGSRLLITRHDSLKPQMWSSATSVSKAKETATKSTAQ